MESSGFYLFFLLAVQNNRVEFATCRSVASSFTIATEAKEMTADNVLDIALSHKFVVSIINEPGRWSVHRLMSVTADKYVDAFEAVNGSVVRVVPGLVLNTENVPRLLAHLAHMTNADIYESALAPITILDAESQSDIIQREVVCVTTCSIILVIAVYDAEYLFLVWF